MVTTMRRWVHVAAILLGCAISPARGEPLAHPSESKAPTKCFDKYHQARPECAFHPRVAQPRIYAGPAGDQPYPVPGLKPSERLPAGFFNDYVADPDDLATGKERVRLYGAWRPSVLWIARTEIVRWTELKRVTGCWPIRRLQVPEGDAEEGWITLERHGSGVLSKPGMPAQPVHAWYVDGVYSIRVEGRNRLSANSVTVEWGWGSIDPGTGKVLEQSGIAAPWDVEVVERREMGEACASGVIVYTQSPAAPAGTIHSGSLRFGTKSSR